MKDSKKDEGQAEAPAVVEVVKPGAALKNHKLVRLDELGTVVYVQLTQREYDLRTINDDQAAQLLSLGWPYVETN